MKYSPFLIVLTVTVGRNVKRSITPIPMMRGYEIMMKYLVIPKSSLSLKKYLVPLPGNSHCHIEEVSMASLVFQRIYIYLEQKAMTIKVNEVNKLQICFDLANLFTVNMNSRSSMVIYSCMSKSIFGIFRNCKARLK